MAEEGSSPYTPELESFLSSAAGMKKTMVDDITMSSLPGTPIAASTVMRQKGDSKERAAVNGTDSRGSLFGPNDPSLSQSKSRSKDSPHFMMDPENTIKESPLEDEEIEGDRQPHDQSAGEVGEFLKAQNVSEMLQRIPFSQLSQPERNPSRSSLLSQSQASNSSSLGILSLDSMQVSDIVGGLADCDYNFGGDSNTAGAKIGLQNTLADISAKGWKDATNHQLKASITDTSQCNEYDNSPLSRGQGSFGAQRLSEAFGSPDTLGTRDHNGDLDGKSSSTRRSGGSEKDRFLMDPARSKDTAAVKRDRTRQSNLRTEAELRGRPPEQGGKFEYRTSREKPAVSRSKEPALSDGFERRSDTVSDGRECNGAMGKKQSVGPSSDVGQTVVNGDAGGSRPERRQQARDERTGVPKSSSGKTAAQQAPVTSGGFGLMTPAEEEEDHQIDQESLQAGLEELDAIFFDPSPTSNSQRSGSGDGEESRCSSVLQSPRTCQGDGGPGRTESQMSAVSLDFGETTTDRQGNFLQDVYDDEAKESEIDTEDEIEAARQESGMTAAPRGMDDIVRPGIEGGSSGDDDHGLSSGSTLEPRQSAEGVVTTSPVPGDGGGGGDGMSDGGSDSGASSMGVRSPVRNGVGGSDIPDERDGDWQGGEAFSEGRDVEGQTRSQPVGDGLMNETGAAGRQVRFASHDDVTRWTPAGSAFHSRLRHPRRSEAESVGNDSLFPAAPAVPQSQSDPTPPSMQQFLQPTRPSVNGSQGLEWSQQGDSLNFSEGASYSQHVAPPGESTVKDFTRTLTPGASSSSQNPFGGLDCSLGSFGMPPPSGEEGGEADITFTQRVSFGEDFSVLEATGGSGSDTSDKRSSSENSRDNKRRPMSGQSSRNSSKGTVYFDDHGQGVTDLAFRTSLPIIHKLGAINPSESFDNQDELEQDIMKQIDFGIDPDEEFIPAEEAQAQIAADESEFMRENIFCQDEHMSPSSPQESSGWSHPNATHLTIPDGISGNEDFCRISLGAFFSIDGKPLGSLSGESGVPRPSFGMKNLSPPVREPTAIHVNSDQSIRDISDDQASPSFERQEGEGGANTGDSEALPDDTRPDADDQEARSINSSSKGKPSFIDFSKLTDEGRVTPPLAVGDIAHILGEISSQCGSEEICQRILEFSNGLHIPTKGKPETDDGEMSDTTDGREIGGREEADTMLKKSEHGSKETGAVDSGAPMNKQEGLVYPRRPPLNPKERRSGDRSKIKPPGVDQSAMSDRSSAASYKDKDTSRPLGVSGKDVRVNSTKTVSRDGSRMSDVPRRDNPERAQKTKTTSHRMCSTDSGVGSTVGSAVGSARSSRAESGVTGGNSTRRSIGPPQGTVPPSRTSVKSSHSAVGRDRMRSRNQEKKQHRGQLNRSQNGSQITNHSHGERSRVDRIRRTDEDGRSERRKDTPDRPTDGTSQTEEARGGYEEAKDPSELRTHHGKSGASESDKRPRELDTLYNEQSQVGMLSLRESLDPRQGNSWATSSSLHTESLSPRGFFKSGRRTERQVASPGRYEVEAGHFSDVCEEEEDISPILEKEMDLGTPKNGLASSHPDRHHRTSLLREESEPDGEPNLTHVAKVANIPRRSQSATSKQVNKLPQTYSKTPVSRTIQSGSRQPYLEHENESAIMSSPAATLESRKSVTKKERFVVAGRHEVMMLSQSQWVHSFNDTTLRPTSAEHRDSLDNTEMASDRGKPCGRLSRSKGHVSSSGVSSSSLSSEDERARSSVSPPLTQPPGKALMRGAITTAEPNVTLHPRSKIDGEESHDGKNMNPVSSHPKSIPDEYASLKPLHHGRYSAPSVIGQTYTRDMNMHASAPLPALLTSQSAADAHSANDAFRSRTGSALSGGFADSRLAPRSAEPPQNPLSRHSSEQYLGETFSNLGHRPLEGQGNFPNFVPTAYHGQPYQLGRDPMGQTQAGAPSYPGYFNTQGPSHGHLPPYAHEVPRGMDPRVNLPQHPPIMSIGTVPGGVERVPSGHPPPVPSYGATHHLGMTGPTDVPFPGYYTTGANLPTDPRHPGTLQMAAGLPADYQRGATCQLVFPAQVQFEGVCCVGIASQSTLPLRNVSGRWLHCLVDVILVTANGEKVSPESSFIIKQRSNIAPHATEILKVIFVPKHPGLYTAVMHVRWSMVVPDTERQPPHLPPRVVTIEALAENPSVEVLEGKDLHFGEMMHGKTRTRPLHVINRGRGTVPVRMMIMSSPSYLNCFTISLGDKKSDAVSPRGAHTSISPVHLSLKGCPASGRDGDLATTATVSVQFEAPPEVKDSKAIQRAETYSAQLHIEMDVPDNMMPLHAINLRAEVGAANLHIPSNLRTMNFSASVGSKDRHKLPLRNSGTIKLSVTFSVSRAEDLFSVSPEMVTLKPGEENSLEVLYAPKVAPSAVESLLTLKTEDDGPQYDITLRGEGVMEKEKHTSSKDTPTLFSNKQYLSWGGVAIGRALQQKVVLRNSSSTLPLKLRITIRDSTDFQLQSSFGSQLQLTDTKSLILKPEEDLPVNILYAPISTAISQGLLDMKPVGGCTKYTVPLSGYGGVSALALEELETVGETSVLPIGTVTDGKCRSFNLRISNNGDRAAFVKAICFNDLTAKIKLPKTHLSVEPHEFVIQPTAVQELRVTYQPTERDGALCYSKSSMVAVVGFFSGDEIMRLQLIKALRLGHARQFQMSSSNPLRGVIFDKTFLNEEDHRSEPSLPSRPNDIQLFYSCMSRLMMALVGDASTGSTLDATALSGILRNQSSLPNTDHTLQGNISRLTTQSSSPPVKMTPSSDVQSSNTLPSTKSPGSWALRPLHLILTASTTAGKTDSCGRVYLINSTERKLSFELTWPGHILTVNPNNGMVPPNEQQMILVSANPSIHSRGVHLPWVGSLRVSCDNTEKEVRVQVREDLALDTSVVPTSSKKLQSLSTQEATPNTTPTVATPSRPNIAPTAAISPKELKVRSKVITCEEVCVGQSSEYIFEFENVKKYPMNWSLTSFAPAYLRQSDGTVCRTTYAAFRFQDTSGQMTPGQKMQLALHFTPREEGDYSQFWDLESSSTQNLVSHKTRIELSGKGLPQQKHSRRVSNPATAITKVKPRKAPDQTQPLDQTSASTRANKSRSKPPSKKPAIEVSDSVCFKRLEVNESQRVTLRLKNCSGSAQKLKFTSPRKPFSISHHELVIKSRHYLKLPVTFHPTTKGKFESPLVIQTESQPQENLVVRLTGECI